MADTLADRGFDPSVIAHTITDLGYDLVKRDGGPVTVVRNPVDPRAKGDK
jgi:hypothetical protein